MPKRVGGFLEPGLNEHLRYLSPPTMADLGCVGLLIMRVDVSLHHEGHHHIRALPPVHASVALAWQLSEPSPAQVHRCPDSRCNLLITPGQCHLEMAMSEAEPRKHLSLHVCCYWEGLSPPPCLPVVTPLGYRRPYLAFRWMGDSLPLSSWRLCAWWIRSDGGLRRG